MSSVFLVASVNNQPWQLSSTCHESTVETLTFLSPTAISHPLPPHTSLALVDPLLLHADGAIDKPVDEQILLGSMM